MARGEAFTHEQMDRLERARRAAEEQTGMRFIVRVGVVDGDVKLAAERMLAGLVDPKHDVAALIAVSPGQRFVRIVTTPQAKHRISDSAAGLATLNMTSSFALGDLVGGLISGLRRLADTAGASAQNAPATPAGL